MHKRAVRGERGVPGQHAISNHKTNIGLPDAGHRRLNRRGRGGRTLFGITLPSTCWELGVKLFYIQCHSHVTTVSVLLASVYYLLSGTVPVRKPAESTIDGALSGEYVQERGARTGFEGHRREQEQVPSTCHWEILAAHDHNFHPIPVQLPTAYRSSHILFGRERTRLVHLTVHGHPALPVQFPDRAAPFSHTQSGTAEMSRDRSPVGQNCALV